jgi:hypothetical protein
MKFTPFIILMAMPSTIMAAESAEVAEPSQWLSIVMAILTTVVIPFLVKFLNKKAEETKVKAENAKLEGNSILADARNKFLDKRLIPFLYETASHTAAVNLPVIVKDSMDGGDFDWKNHLSKLKDEILDLTKAKFATEGIDIVANVGEEYLDNLLDRALAKAIPFLPEVTHSVAKESGDKITDGISQAIVKGGLEYAKQMFVKMQKEEAEKEG